MSTAFYSFISKKFYFGNEDLPPDAIPVNEDEYGWDDELNSWEFNNKFLGRIIFENLVEFNLTINPQGEGGSYTQLFRFYEESSPVEIEERK
jgi:hypothetical protein